MKDSDLYMKEYKLQSEADEVLREYWVTETFLTWQWWLLVALTVLPWLLWLKVVDRKRFFEILTYGMLVKVVATFLDALGVEFDFWDYQIRLIPLFDVFIAYDFSVLPVSYMLVYQYFSSWKSFLLASIALSALFAFIAEPLLVYMNFYHMVKWGHIYSFPFFFAVAVFIKGLMALLKKLSG
ncbi:MAG: CBO0543 family protein [Bacillota bacterium]